jgi:hypothetical protein
MAKLIDDTRWLLYDGCWNLKFTLPDGHKFAGHEVHAFIQPRPDYCDRGHWVFNVDGPLEHDGADSFPRYFMDLERAKAEAEAYLLWRLFRQ